MGRPGPVIFEKFDGLAKLDGASSRALFSAVRKTDGSSSACGAARFIATRGSELNQS